jgi:hypothetical protein
VQLGRLPPRVATEQADVTAVGAEQAKQHADGGRLARAVGAEEAVHLAGGDGEVKAIECAGPSERLRQP